MTKEYIIEKWPGFADLFKRAEETYKKANKRLWPDWGEYERFKKEMAEYVGWKSNIPELRGSDAYRAAIEAICDALHV
jgi:hypothetical protein